MKNRIRAIETEYQGYRFRSRLEARWATFFSSMGIDWGYEPEGFEMEWEGEVLRYLPDFWLPQVRTWAEVKPVEFTDIERAKLQALSRGSECSALMLVGIPDIRTYTMLSPYGDPEGTERVLVSRFLNEGIHSHFPPIESYPDFGADYRQAVRAARSARFEQYPRNLRRVLENAGAI